MTKSELIKALSDYSDDAIVIIGDSDCGWCNIDQIKPDGSQISFVGDCYPDHNTNEGDCWCQPEEMLRDGAKVFIHREFH